MPQAWRRPTCRPSRYPAEGPHYLPPTCARYDSGALDVPTCWGVRCAAAQEVYAASSGEQAESAARPMPGSPPGVYSLPAVKQSKKVRATGVHALGTRGKKGGRVASALILRGVGVGAPNGGTQTEPLDRHRGVTRQGRQSSLITELRIAANCA